MALSSYYRKYDAENLDALNQQKQIINQTADASIKMIEDAGNAQIKEAEHAYDGVINTANVQKLINERAVAERMSNMGLTDSGLNRTQQTAIELSRSNAINNANIARQKQIDALALAVSQQVGQINIQRNTDIMNADLTYNANRDSWASSMYDADQQAAAARYKARLDRDAKMAQMQIDAENERLDARNKLFEKLYDEELTNSQKANYINSFNRKYGEDDEVNNWIDVQGWKRNKSNTDLSSAEYQANYYKALDLAGKDLESSGKLDPYIKALGTPGAHLNKYDRGSIANQIQEWLESGIIDDMTAEYLLRKYNISEATLK